MNVKKEYPQDNSPLITPAAFYSNERDKTKLNWFLFEYAAEEGISTEEKQKVAVQILNLTTGESYTGRLAITGTHQLYLPVEIQQMLKGSGLVRIRLL